MTIPPMSKPLCIDLFSGLGGWSHGFLAEGWECVGFDIERHEYGGDKYPAQLVLQDVLTLHGKQFAIADCIVASPPCQAYSYRAMPWKRAKALPPPDNTLFEACFRIQREACEAAGHHIPLVVENVRGAQKWVGRSRWNFGSFHLWGDVPALMPMTKQAVKVAGLNWNGSDKPGYVARAFNTTAEQRLRNEIKNSGGSWFAIGSPGQKELSRNPAHDGVKQHKSGRAWFADPDSISGSTSSKSKARKARKAASAAIAKIPFALASYIARTFKPEEPRLWRRRGES